MEALECKELIHAKESRTVENQKNKYSIETKSCGIVMVRNCNGAELDCTPHDRSAQKRP